MFNVLRFTLCFEPQIFFKIDFNKGAKHVNGQNSGIFVFFFQVKQSSNHHSNANIC